MDHYTTLISQYANARVKSSKNFGLEPPRKNMESMIRSFYPNYKISKLNDNLCPMLCQELSIENLLF